MNHHHHHDDTNGKALLAFLAGAATAAAVGGYYLYGPNGRQHRQDVEDYVEATKDRINEKMEQAGDWSQATYNRVVNEVTNDARLVRRVGHAKARQLGKRFRDRWEDMRDAAESAAGQAELELAQEDEGEL